MTYQLLTPTIIPRTDAILYQTDNSAEMQVVKEKYEAMGWEVWIKTTNNSPD
tara:strand:+ start:657 stop:812 length:156 start_codon:yes stop_codon:yes gene_type:complete